MYEFGKNKLRLQEKIKGKSYNLVGIFYEAEEKDGEFKVVLLEEWSSSSYVYAFVPESARDAILKMDRGSLVTITCTGLEKYGSHPSFKSCDFLRHTDTGGEKADMFLDDLIAKNNELLGNTPNF